VVVLCLLAMCGVVSIFGSPLVGDVAGAVGLLVLLGVLMNTFVGRTMSTMSEAERTAFFQRVYRPRRRWDD
jgi:hypothetical protein